MATDHPSDPHTVLLKRPGGGVGWGVGMLWTPHGADDSLFAAQEHSRWKCTATARKTAPSCAATTPRRQVSTSSRCGGRAWTCRGPRSTCTFWTRRRSWSRCWLTSPSTTPASTPHALAVATASGGRRFSSFASQSPGDWMGQFTGHGGRCSGGWRSGGRFLSPPLVKSSEVHSGWMFAASRQRLWEMKRGLLHVYNG